MKLDAETDVFLGVPSIKIWRPFLAVAEDEPCVRFILRDSSGLGLFVSLNGLLACLNAGIWQV